MSRIDDAFDAACRETMQRYSGQKTATTILGKKIDVDDEERTASTVITTEAVDRDKEVVLSKGLNLKQYLKNPVVLFMHDMDIVVGKSLWVKKQDRASGINRIVAKCKFAETAKAQEVFALVSGDFIRATSIGMHPFSAKVRKAKPSEIKSRPEMADVSVIESAEMLEWSWVGIPSNPEALTTAYSKGMFKETLPYYEPIIKAVTDANPRKKPFLRVVSEGTDVVVIKKLKPRVIVNAESIAKRVAVMRALKAGRL